MKTLYKWLRSPKLALVLITTIVVIYISGMLFPQQHLLTPLEFKNWQQAYPTVAKIGITMGLTSFYNTYYFIGAVLLLFVNTLLCTINQVTVYKRRIRTLGSLDISSGVRISGGQVTKLENLLSAKGYKLKHGVATKGGLGLLGGLLFHVALLLVITGALISALYRVEGFALISEGQPFYGQPKQYNQISKGPLIKLDAKEMMIGVDAVTITYPEDKSVPTEYSAHLVELTEDGQVARQQDVKVNQNMMVAGYDIYLATYGYSPGLVINKGGQQIYGAYLALNTIRNSEAWTDEYTGETKLPTGETLKVQLLVNSVDPSKFNVMNPVVMVNLATSGQPGQEVQLQQGETKKIEDYEITFPELRKNGAFIIAKDPGDEIVFLGGWLATMAMLLWYFVNPRAIVYRLNGTDLEIAGRSYRYPVAFAEEMEELQHALSSANN